MEDSIKQLIDMVAKLKITMMDRFDEFDKRFNQIDSKFDKIDKRFNKIDEKFEMIDERFNKIEDKLAEHDKRFARIEDKLQEHDKRFDRIEEKFTNSLKLIGHDVQNNKRHIEKLENNDDYYNVSE